MKKITSIFLNGKYDRRRQDFYKNHVHSSDYVIAADGGVVFLNSIGIVPDLLIGDGDSSDFDSAKAKEKIRHPSDKDYTDGELALQQAIERRPGNRINIYGALTRAEEADQFFGNLGLLYQAMLSEKTAVFRNPKQDIYIASAFRETEITGSKGDIISFSTFSSPIANVTATGLKWEVKDAEIVAGSGKFLRNRIVESSVNVSVKKGTVLVFHGKRGDTLSYPV